MKEIFFYNDIKKDLASAMRHYTMLNLLGWVVLFLKRRRELDYKRFQQASANQSNIVQLVSGIQEIKLNTCEKQKRLDTLSGKNLA